MPTTTSLDTGSMAAFAAFMGTYAVVLFAFAVVMIIAYWKVFTKAGEAGWQSLIPIWNVMVILKIAGRPMWWILLMLIPLVNLVVLAIVYLDIAKAFGFGIGFALGLIFLSPIFWLILGFGGSQYIGAGGAGMTMTPPPSYAPPQPVAPPAPVAEPVPPVAPVAAPVPPAAEPIAPVEPPTPPSV